MGRKARSSRVTSHRVMLCIAGGACIVVNAEGRSSLCRLGPPDILCHGCNGVRSPQKGPWSDWIDIGRGVVRGVL